MIVRHTGISHADFDSMRRSRDYWRARCRRAEEKNIA